MTVAGGITFFILLAMFPAIGIVVSLFGMLGDPSSITHIIDLAAPFLPGGAITVLNEELHRLIQQKAQQLGLAFFAGLVISLWSASGGIKALMDGLNIAFETRESRSIVGFTLHALAITGLAIGFAITACYLILIVPAAPSHHWLQNRVTLLSPILQWILSFLFCLGLIEIVYRFGPDQRARRSWFSWGSVTAALLWICVTIIFSWYANGYGSYDRVYGSLGAIVGFLTWIWLLLVILLSGAELDFEIDRARSERNATHPATGENTPNST
jgi:membrane protein